MKLVARPEAASKIAVKVYQLMDRRSHRQSLFRVWTTKNRNFLRIVRPQAVKSLPWGGLSRRIGYTMHKLRELSLNGFSIDDVPPEIASRYGVTYAVSFTLGSCCEEVKIPSLGHGYGS